MINNIVRGMVAGLVGTAAMTLTERLEIAISGRPSSTVPGQVGSHLIPGKDPASTTDVQGLNAPVHWAHGVSMGAVRGLLDSAGLTGPAATAAHFALLWGGDATLYTTLGVADAPWHWSAGELASDLLHKGFYAVVTGEVYDSLSG